MALKPSTAHAFALLHALFAALDRAPRETEKETKRAEKMCKHFSQVDRDLLAAEFSLGFTQGVIAMQEEIERELRFTQGVIAMKEELERELRELEEELERELRELE